VNNNLKGQLFVLGIIFMGGLFMVHGYSGMDKAEAQAAAIGVRDFHPLPETCTEQGMEQCELSCMMPNGLINLNCYEACIFSIC